MQNHSPLHSSSSSDGRPGTPRAARPSTNNDASLLSKSLNRLSLHAAANAPLPRSPSVHSPRHPSEPHRTPSSPANPPDSLRRSSSVVSLHRSSSPALGRKSSSTSLRGDMPGTPRPSVSRRSSFAPNMPSPIGANGAKSPLFPPVEEKEPLRACDVAEDYFKRELAVHEGVAGAVTAGTIVIVHDQCYGHRYSRPKTHKSTLSLIMERPERILASVLGISAAYVRLGERHCDGSNPPHPDQNPERVPFKIRKTSRTVDITSQVVTNVHGVKWMEELKSLCVNAERKLASTGKELSREGPNVPGQPPKEKFHEGDLYLCAESLNAFQGALGGVLDAVDAVFQGTSIGSGPSRAFVCVRPPGHHCSADFPSGFCWLNNVHVGIEHAMMNYGLTHAAIIDFDLHHGDGSQSITWARNKKVQNMSKNTPNWKKTSIGYFSLHDINSYPCEDGDDAKVQAASLCIDSAHGQSIWNIHLQEWRTIEEFWSIYEEKYLVLLEKTRQYLKHHTNRLKTSPNHPTPKAAIFLSAGFDASEWETAGMQRHSVNVPTEFYARFTQDVVRLAEEAGTGVEGRVISVLEGGYSERALASGVLSHISGLCDGQVWSDARPSKGLAVDMRQRLGGLSMRDEDNPMQSAESALTPTPITYEPHWWNESNLAELQNLVSPGPTAIPKKPRTGPPPTYSSPTQSFTAKVVDPSKMYRNIPGKFMSASPSRPPTPPPPDVDWATAARALSKLLVPSDRQTESCKPEELAEPKIKKEKPAAPALTSVRLDPSGRQLRGRKPATSYADPNSGDEKSSVRPASRANRRRTIADLPLAVAEPPAGTRTVSRRMSIASSVGSVSGDVSASRTSSVAPSRRSVTPAPGTAVNGVPVKKSRGASTTASRIPKNQPPPVPRVPSGYVGQTVLAKEKENDMDQLTTGLKRITLKLPSKEEYEARERQKEAEKKAAAKPRKAAAPRAPKATSKTVPKPVAAKKAPGRPSKVSKPVSPVEPEVPAPVLTPEPPRIESAATAPLEAPQPIQPDQVPSVLPIANERRISMEPIQPPTELREMDISPAQLPKPSFTTAVEPLPVTISPPRPDTPPPPPPATIPQFIHHNPHSFGTVSTISGNQTAKEEAQVPLQWLPPNVDIAPPANTAPAVHPIMSPASKRQDLPKFASNGMIPFTSNPNSAMTSMGTSVLPTQQVGGNTTSKTADHERDVWEVPETPTR